MSTFIKLICILVHPVPGAQEVVNSSGVVVFRGPRVKMGIYEGVPTRALPHSTTGRADYFGQLVNRAARFCHAAAKGGQVLIFFRISFMYHPQVSFS